MNKPVPSYLKALGRKSLPDTIDLNERTYNLTQIFKNDFFAVTALYECPGEKILVKIQRQASLFLFPMQWIGRILARREWNMLRRVQDIDGIPKLIQRWGPTGLIREFVDGQPLKKGERVPDDFHAQLHTLIDKIHDRKMAYVDLEKCENVLVDSEGRPWLFDFQIAWYVPPHLGGELWPLRKIRTWLQNGDRYHLLKLKRRTRPDQLSPEQLQASYKKPWYVHVHRWVTMPFTRTRRAVLDRLDPRRGGFERGRVIEEKATGEKPL